MDRVRFTRNEMTGNADRSRVRSAGAEGEA
jgi:hypothetical protein